jgi:predicted aconitase with swiveling domain/ADP-ribose pyrophosphatase YjhB (NUDIX family)
VCSSPLSFLGGVDTSTGRILDDESGSKGLSVSEKVLCFPFGKGSTVGSYALYQLRLNKLAPAAIVNSSAEPIIATGAIIADIPMVDGIDVNLLRTGDRLLVDADDARVEIIDVTEKHVVTSILKDRSKILLLQRSDRVGSYRGQWAGVSGFVERDETDEDAVRREMEEEIGSNKLKLLKHAEAQRFRDGAVVWCVHPFLFEVREPRIRTDWEHKKFEWVAPEDVVNYQTVPGLQQVISSLLCRR